MILSVAVAAVSLGVAGGIALAAEDYPATGAEDSSTTGESAKMGKGEGTHTGPTESPERDTSKIVQPPRRNPTTGDETPTEDRATGAKTGQ